MDKEGKVEKIITRIVIGICFLFMVLIIACAIAIKAGASSLFKMDHSIETRVYEVNADDDIFTKVYKGYNNAAYAVKNYTDAYSNDLLLGRTQIVENEVRYKHALGFTIFAPGEYNSLLYLDNGYLASANPKETKEDVQKIATKIKSLKDVAQESGAGFIYMQTPGNIDKFGDNGINQVKDFANYNADLLVEDLRGYGIECFDIRDNMHASFDDYRSLFFRTDHHWRQPIALWATNELCSVLNKNFGFEYDESFYDESKYDIEVLKEHYLGSLGRKATLAAATPDDFELMHPKFDCKLRLSLDKKGQDEQPWQQEGNFEALYDMYEMNFSDIYWRECFLALLSFYGTGKATVENLDTEKDDYVIFVADSLCIPITGFISLNCKKVELIDPRYFKGSIKEYIREAKPDIVVNSYSTTIIQDYYPIFNFD